VDAAVTWVTIAVGVSSLAKDWGGPVLRALLPAVRKLTGAG